MLKHIVLSSSLLALAAPALAGSPYFGPRPAMIVNQGQAVNVDVTPADTDNDVVSVTATGVPPGMALTVTSSSWTAQAINTSPNIADALVIETGSNGVTYVGETHPYTGTLHSLGANYSSQLVSNAMGKIGDVLPLPDGSVLVSDFSGHKVWTVTGGQATVLTGSSQGYTNGALSAAKFQGPFGLARSASGDIYVGETYGKRLRKISATGQVSTINSFPSAAVTGLEFEPSGTLLVSSANNGLFRFNLANGNVTTLASGNISGFDRAADGSIYYTKMNGILKLPAGSTAETISTAYSYPGDVEMLSNNSFLVTNTSQNNLLKFTNQPTAWAITGTYNGGNCGGSYKAMITATDAQGNSAQTSVDMTIPSVGPGCGPPPGGPSGGTIAPTGGTGGRTIGGGTVVTRPSAPSATISTRQKEATGCKIGERADDNCDGVADKPARAKPSPRTN